MSRLGALERALEEEAGQRVVERVQRGELTSTRRDLPIRHHKTGEVMAYVPGDLAKDMLPVALNGFVVGYYRETETGTFHPSFFHKRRACALVKGEKGERWAEMFDDDGTPLGGLRLA